MLQVTSLIWQRIRYTKSQTAVSLLSQELPPHG